jgi:DNA adenine methylase
MPKPFLKWVGGKTQILDEVINLFPPEINNYYEPFIGGGSVLIGMLSKGIAVTGRIYASDINTVLIGLYKNIQNNCDKLIEEVNKLKEVFSNIVGTTVNRNPTSLEEASTSPESYYYWIRSVFRTIPEENKMGVPASAMFLFLNKTCFRGVYREGPSGFNVPFGHYKNPAILEEDRIRELSVLLKDVIFSKCSFEEALSRLEPGDFVYLDPPYVPENITSFVGYTSDGFNKHETLFSICKEMPAKMLLSNSKVKVVLDSFADKKYKIKIISCKRTINSKNPESRIDEVLITN